MLGVPAFSALLTLMLVLRSFANHNHIVHALCRREHRRPTKTESLQIAAMT